MKTITTKEIIAVIYFTICLFALTGEPTGEKSMTYYVVYYSIMVTNFIISALILNRIYKKRNANTTTTDWNRIS